MIKSAVLRVLSFFSKKLKASLPLFLLSREFYLDRNFTNVKLILGACLKREQAITAIVSRALDENKFVLLDFVVRNSLARIDIFQEVRLHGTPMELMEKLLLNNKVTVDIIKPLITKRMHEEFTAKFIDYMLLSIGLLESSQNDIKRKVEILIMFRDSMNALGGLADYRLKKMLTSMLSKLERISNLPVLPVAASNISVGVNSTRVEHSLQAGMRIKIHYLNQRYGVPTDKQCLEAYNALNAALAAINENIDNYERSDFFRYAGIKDPNKAEILGVNNKKVYVAKISESHDNGRVINKTLLAYAKEALPALLSPDSYFWRSNYQQGANSIYYHYLVYYMYKLCLADGSLELWKEYSVEKYNKDPKGEVLRHKYSALYVLILKLYQMHRSYNAPNGLDDQKFSRAACEAGRVNIIMQFIEEFTNALEDPCLVEISSNEVESILYRELDKEEMSVDVMALWASKEVNDATAFYSSRLAANSAKVIKENFREKLRLPEDDESHNIEQLIRLHKAQVYYIAALRSKPVTDQMRTLALINWDNSLKKENATFYADKKEKINFLTECLQCSSFKINEGVYSLLASYEHEKKRQGVLALSLPLPKNLRQYQADRTIVEMKPGALHYLLSQQIKQFWREDGPFADWLWECLAAWELPRKELEANPMKKSLAGNLDCFFEHLFGNRFDLNSIEKAREELALMTLKEKNELRKGLKPAMIEESRIEACFKELYVVFKQKTASDASDKENIFTSFMKNVFRWG